MPHSSEIDIVKKWLSVLTGIVLSVAAPAQDLSGFWKGTLTMFGGCFPVNNIELQLKVQGSSVTGDSYHYLDVNNYIKKKSKGSYDSVSKKIIVQEGAVITYHIPSRCEICVKKFELIYSKEGNVETLSGHWTGHIINSSRDCIGGSIVLTRIKESTFKEIPEIRVDTGQIRLDFYDNAQIDGDSITVLVNGNTVVSNQILGLKPITLFVTVDLRNTFHEIEMIANNLGSIPPNTALLIITTGEKRYQLFLSSTKAKSAMVRLVYEGEATADIGDKH